MDNKKKIIDSPWTKARMKGPLSKYVNELEKDSVDSIIELPVSKVYYSDIIRLFGLFDLHFKAFKAEIDTYKDAYLFDETNYTRIDGVDKSEDVDALFLAYYGESPDPRVFLMLTPVNAAICINDKYGIPYGFYEDAYRLLSKNRRLLDRFFRLNIDYVIIIAVIAIIVAALLGAGQILLVSITVVSSLIIATLYAVAYYAKRRYYRVYLCEAPVKKGPIGSAVAKMLEALHIVFN
ncbi:hypothetical protein MCP_2476 [Methanocella paludicola SANAE]|uniref:Uncharacterized protein n=1 Tax=Methanocella paludicola (strain DSM 17711 / JCM 13418 / NBRC 101707 / SANAE) TaxID=304371 RepID=D1Z1H6_METPS|nr:hypothetical protein [Methanocella paludicola]BAI62548.1 hypothetical protein MCP_2476 [Methanocella paludicola SANAE]